MNCDLEFWCRQDVGSDMGSGKKSFFPFSGDDLSLPASAREMKQQVDVDTGLTTSKPIKINSVLRASQALSQTLAPSSP